MPEALEAEIRQLYDDWIANPSAVVCARLADRLRIAGRPLEAIDVAGRGLSEWPANTSIRVVLGRCHRDAGNATEAKEAFEKVLETDPINLIALKGLAEISLAGGMFSEAARLFGDYLFENPADSEAERMLEEAKAGAAAPAAQTPPAVPQAAPPTAEAPAVQAAPPAPAEHPPEHVAETPAMPGPASADEPALPERPMTQEAPSVVMPAPEVPPEAASAQEEQQQVPEAPAPVFQAPVTATILEPPPGLPPSVSAEVASAAIMAPAPLIEEKPFWPEPEPAPAVAMAEAPAVQEPALPEGQPAEPGPGTGLPPEVPPEIPVEIPAQAPPGMPSDFPLEPPAPPVTDIPAAIASSPQEAVETPRAARAEVLSLDSLFGIRTGEQESAAAEAPPGPDERPSTPASALLEAFGIKAEPPAPAEIPQVPPDRFPPTARMERVIHSQGMSTEQVPVKAATPAEATPAPAAPALPRAEAKPQQERPAAPAAPRQQSRRDPRSLLDLFGTEEREELGLEPYRQEDA